MTTTTNKTIVVCLAAIAAMAAAPAAAEEVTPPVVPTNIQAPAGTKAFFEGHAVGTQNYICLPSATALSGFAWTLFGPQATLFNEDGKQVVTHFLSANPYEAGLPRATWQANDTSSAWAGMIQQSSDPAFVAPGSIAWFLLQVFGAQVGPTGGDKLTRTTFIQRVNTYGGVAPSTGCAQATDVGKRSLVPYEADYVFYRNQDGN